MPKCEKCGQVIDYLTFTQAGWQKSNFRRSASDDQRGVHEDVQFVREGDIEHFACPRCHADLFFDYNDALHFLNS